MTAGAEQKPPMHEAIRNLVNEAVETSYYDGTVAGKLAVYRALSQAVKKFERRKTLSDQERAALANLKIAKAVVAAIFPHFKSGGKSVQPAAPLTTEMLEELEREIC
ncbi:MAG: hypothetical protein AAFY06_00170 [Pseudomonadota bacterium]